MPRRISINIGFVTNSSSVVHHFPGELLKHPKIATFLKTFEIESGFVSDDLWDRSACTTIAVTPEQKAEVVRQLSDDPEARRPAINVDSDEIVVIYGDEYQSIAHTLVDLICEALAEAQGGEPWDYRYLNSGEYN